MTLADWALVAIVMAMAFGVMGYLSGLWLGWWRSSDLDRKLEENRQVTRLRAAQRRESSMKGRRWPLP